MRLVFFAALGLFALGTVGCVGADDVDEEALDAPEDETEAAAAGEIKIEVESVDPVAPWVKRSALAGFTGTGYFEWTGGDKLNPPPQGVLTYTFNVPRAGNYIIGVRGRRDQAGVCRGAASDQCNDVFSRIDGGPWEKTMVKGAWGTWIWDEKWEPDHGVVTHKVRLAKGRHTISLGGRSKGVKIDALRIRPE